jgi:hypothetical protein
MLFGHIRARPQSCDKRPKETPAEEGGVRTIYFRDGRVEYEKPSLEANNRSIQERKGTASAVPINADGETALAAEVRLSTKVDCVVTEG